MLTLKLAANALCLLSFLPLLAKLKWRRVRRLDDSTTLIVRDTCQDISLSTQIYMFLSLLCRYYITVLKRSGEFVVAAQRITKRIKRSKSPTENAYKIAMLFLLDDNLQSGILQAIILATSLCCVVLLLIRGSPLGRGWLSYTAMVFVPFVAAAIAFGPKLEVFMADPTPEAFVDMAYESKDMYSMILGLLSIFPQAFMTFTKPQSETNDQFDTSSEGATLFTALHVICYGSGSLLLALTSMGKYLVENLETFTDIQNLNNAIGSMSTDVLLTLVSFLGFTVALWSVTKGRRWLFLAASIFLAFLTQIFMSGDILKIPQIDQILATLQIVTAGFIFLFGGFAQVQALYVVALLVMYHQGLLPSSASELSARLQTRLAEIKGLINGMLSKRR
mmetsp:Transcript_1120/g.1558  ORF Transcript_1120/g.1558 Transcript_1120/m.1558 type:complete len:391 (-) Transcript_1120:50-1222(-)